MQNNELSKLAVAVTIEKKIKEYTNPRGGAHGAPTARTEADDALHDLYISDGVTQKTIFVNGEKVGTLSAKQTKPVHDFVPVVKDVSAYRKWLSDNAEDVIDVLLEIAPKQVLEAATDGGVLPDGVEVVEDIRPAAWAGTTLRVDSDAVIGALGAALPSTVAQLLGSGEL